MTSLGCTCNARDCTSGSGHESYCGRVEPDEDVCGLCSHTVNDHADGLPILGGEADLTPLCHTDDHSCYHLWTVYGERPVGAP